jgi:hypothetical protein
VVARESAHVVAWGSAHVEGFQNASFKVQEATVVIDRLRQSAIAICLDTQCTVTEKDDSAQVIVCPRVLHDIGSFCDIYKQNMVGKTAITLYKTVKADFTDHYTGEITYAADTELTCLDWDPNPKRQCGGGLHLSPTPYLALSYHQGNIMKCEVKINDIVIYAPDITKVRCRMVKVLEEVRA